MTTTALITGASSGIGLELARIHAEAKGDLVLVARRENRLKEIKAELEAAHQVRVDVISEDLSDENAPQRIFDEVKIRGVEINILINNAGFGGRGKFHEQQWSASRDMINVNVLAVAALTRLFLPDIVKLGTGRILMVSSTPALSPGPLQAVYFATKAFVSSFSNALAEEFSGTSITVTNFMPTATTTQFAATAGMDITRLFESTSTARNVAQDGYDAMMQGKLDAFGGMRPKRRLQQILLKLLPKTLAMRAVRNAQEAR